MNCFCDAREKSKTASGQMRASENLPVLICRCTPLTTARSSCSCTAKTVTARGSRTPRLEPFARWNPSCRDSRNVPQDLNATSATRRSGRRNLRPKSAHLLSMKSVTTSLPGGNPKLRKNLISPKTKRQARSKMVPATRPRKRFHSNRLKRKQMDKTDGLRFGYEYAFNDTR